jgi:hypothetical protein
MVLAACEGLNGEKLGNHSKTGAKATYISTGAALDLPLAGNACEVEATLGPCEKHYER